MKLFREMPKLRKIELMVEAGVITPEHAERAKKKVNATKVVSKPKAFK